MVLAGNTGCSTPLENVVIVREKDAQVLLPYFSPEVVNCSIESQGEIPYEFSIKIRTEFCQLEASTEPLTGHEIPEPKGLLKRFIGETINEIGDLKEITNGKGDTEPK